MDTHDRKARVAFFSVLGALGALAAAGISVSEFAHGLDATWRSLSSAVGDGALVSFVAAVALEPYLRTRFMRETRADIMWGIFNDKATPAHRRALEQLAGSKHYTLNTTWTVTFEWVDESKSVLEILTEADNNAVSEDAGGYKPSGRNWVLASCEGHDSAYVHWSITAPGVKEWSRNNIFDEAQLVKRGYVAHEYGRAIVDEKKIANGRAIPEGKHYNSKRRTRMFRHNIGYIPLVYSRLTLEADVVIQGGALAALEVSFLHPAQTGSSAPNEERRSGGAGEPFRIDYVTLPGQATLLTWRPRRPENDRYGSARDPGDDTATEVG